MLWRGPYAQDWHAAFPSAKDNLMIDTMDLDGITLSAVKGLIIENKRLKGELDLIKERLDKLELKSEKPVLLCRNPSAARSSFQSHTEPYHSSYHRKMCQ